MSHRLRTLALVASSFETGIELRLGMWRGCTVWEGPPLTVETIAEARSAILRHAMTMLDHHAHDPEKRRYRRLNVGPNGPTWDDLAQCEGSRRYDPSKPEEGMRCSYLLYRQRGIRGVGGSISTYFVRIWATAPPEVWDHAADQPAGLDSVDAREIAIGR